MCCNYRSEAGCALPMHAKHEEHQTGALRGY